MNYLKFASALTDVGPAPCTKYDCDKIAKCASEVTDCKAFRYWVNNGTFSKPSKKTRRAEMNSIPITVEMFTRKSIRFDVGLNIKSVEV